MKRIICLIPVLLAVACAITSEVAIECDPAKRNFSVAYPAEWKQLNTREAFIISRDGPFSQYILFRQRHFSQPFPHTAKRLRKDMPALEAAEVVIDEMRSDPLVLDLRITETGPATVNRYEGFKILFTYGTKDGRTFNTVYYGFLHGDWLYSIRYNAASHAFTEKDLQDFDKVLNSFTCKG